MKKGRSCSLPIMTSEFKVETQRTETKGESGTVKDRD